MPTIGLHAVSGTRSLKTDYLRGQPTALGKKLYGLESWSSQAGETVSDVSIRSLTTHRERLQDEDTIGGFKLFVFIIGFILFYGLMVSRKKM